MILDNRGSRRSCHKKVTLNRRNYLLLCLDYYLCLLCCSEIMRLFSGAFKKPIVCFTEESREHIVFFTQSELSTELVFNEIHTIFFWVGIALTLHFMCSIRMGKGQLFKYTTQSNTGFTNRMKNSWKLIFCTKH